MSLYTINEIKTGILKVSSDYEFLFSVPDGENLYLVYGLVEIGKMKDVQFIKVCWSNNMIADCEYGSRMIRTVPLMKPTVIDEKLHVFEILNTTITDDDFYYVQNYIAKKLSC